MPRHAALVYILTAAAIAAATPAGAVVKGTKSSSPHYTVRLVGNGYCSGVVIARRAVATAGHCAQGMSVIAGGRAYRVAGISRSALLDDGRQVSVTGDAAILQLAKPLPPEIEAAPVGEGEGDIFTIAGYGTTDEHWRGTFGKLHEAVVVPAEPRALVDPNRTGWISASACFGDSGGPVMRGGMLVGIITRAAHPSPRIACGDLTRWAAITASATAEAPAVPNAAAAMVDETAAKANEKTNVAEPRAHQHRRHVVHKPASETAALMPYNTWYALKVEARRLSRHKQAQR